jgi:hypoxanthine phosphoribosyltransferase
MTEKLRKTYGPIANDIQQIVYTGDEIQERVAQIGQAISRDYLGRNPLVVGVLKGVLFFMADLLRNISVPVEIDFIAVSSYSPESRDRGYVRMVKDLDIPIYNRHILFVEDVIDTGLTLNYILKNLRTRQPATLEVCVLFNKSEHRLIDIPIKYKGFDLQDQFVVGYGLDYKEKYRNLPFLGSLQPAVFQKIKNGD